MKPGDVVRESQAHEAARIGFLEETRGREEARVFAARTLQLYRRAVVQRAAPAGEKVFRLRLMGSYCYLKRYLQSDGRDALWPILGDAAHKQMNG